MTYTSITDTPASIRELQEYLYYISFADSDIPRVYPGGVYGENTEKSVKAFQKKYHLPITGSTDLRTWDAIVFEYRRLKEERRPPSSIKLFPGRKYVVKPGEKSATSAHIQLLLSELSEELGFPDEIAITGVYSDADVNAVKNIQKLHSLPVTGNVDRDTWDAICQTYEYYKNMKEPE